MATIEEVKNRIAVCNAKSASLNQTRQYNIGQRNSIQKQLDAAISAYNAKYGTNISVDNIDAELSNVCAEKEKEIQAVEQMITLIDSGDYAGAMKLAGEEVPVVETSAPKESEPLNTGVVNTGATPVGMVVKEEKVADVSNNAELGASVQSSLPNAVEEPNNVGSEESEVLPAPPAGQQSVAQEAQSVSEVPVAPPPAAPAMPVMPAAPFAPATPATPVTPAMPSAVSQTTEVATSGMQTGMADGQAVSSGGLGGFDGALSGFSRSGAVGLGGMENLPAPPTQKPVTDFKEILGGSDFPISGE